MKPTDCEDGPSRSNRSGIVQSELIEEQYKESLKHEYWHTGPDKPYKDPIPLVIGPGNPL